MRKNVVICDFCEKEFSANFFKHIKKFDMCRNCHESFSWLAKNGKLDLLPKTTELVTELYKIRENLEDYKKKNETTSKSLTDLKRRLRDIHCILNNSNLQLIGNALVKDLLEISNI